MRKKRLTKGTKNKVSVYSINNAPTGHYFLGISLISNGYFSKKRLEKFYQALTPKLNSFNIIIADSFEIWNYIYFKNLSYIKARNKALEVASQYKNGYLKLAKSLPNFSIHLSSELEKLSEFRRLTDILKISYKTNERFNSAVKSQVIENIGNKLSANVVSDILANYLLEEIALTVSIYSGIFEENYIQVSPRKDKLLLNLYNNIFPKVSHELGLNSTDFRYVIYRPIL